MSLPCSRISALLFDWDGTLSDTAAAGLAAFERTFAELGYPLSRETYEKIYSPNWYSMYESLSLPRELWQQADALWLRHYGLEAPRFVDGALEVMTELRKRGYRFGVVSSGTCSRVAREAEQLGLKGWLEAVICNEEIMHKKPHPEGLIKAMDQMTCRPEMCCYIGDSPEDIQMGRNAGVFTVGVPSAYPTSRNLSAERPDLCLRTLRELPHHFTGTNLRKPAPPRAR